MEYEIKSAGMVYYRNAIDNPLKVIGSIEYMQDQLAKGTKSAAQPWHEWNGANPEIEKFCLRYFVLFLSLVWLIEFLIEYRFFKICQYIFLFFLFILDEYYFT